MPQLRFTTIVVSEDATWHDAMPQVGGCVPKLRTRQTAGQYEHHQDSHAKTQRKSREQKRLSAVSHRIPRESERSHEDPWEDTIAIVPVHMEHLHFYSTLLRPTTLLLLPGVSASSSAHRETLATAGSLTTSNLGDESTTLDGVDKNVSRWEEEVRPGTSEDDLATNSIILRVDVEESVGGDIASSWVAADGANVMHPQTSAVVALVDEVINNVQVVVDTLVVDCEESTGCLWITKVTHVDDVSDRASGRSWSLSTNLVELVVEDHELMTLISPPALVAVGSARVAEAAEYFGCWNPVLTGGIVDGDGVLVVTNADVASTELTVWSLVGHALGVMDIPVLRSAAW